MPNEHPSATDPSDAATEEIPDEVADATPLKQPSELHIAVTGANSGIGFEASEQLASRGATVIMVCRDRARGEEAAESIRRATSSTRVELRVADLSSMGAVRQLAKELVADGGELDVLVNNAGIKLNQRVLTPEGNETMLAVNHLAPYLLSQLLQPALERTQGRIVTVNSFMHKRASGIDDPQSESGFSEMGSYAKSKLFNLLTSYAQAASWRESGVTFNTYNPGFVRTKMTRGGLAGVAAPLFGKSARTAAQTITFLSLSPRVHAVTGNYYLASGRSANSSRTSLDEELQQRAVTETEAILAAVPIAAAAS